MDIGIDEGSGRRGSTSGRVLDERYQMIRLLGHGGMGVVYLAETLGDRAPVVIKMIRPQLRDDPDIVARFERESRRLGELRHPNIVEYLNAGEDRGTPYLAMEWIDGELLSDALRRRRRFGYPEFAPIAGQILSAVRHAHARGVLIRDIKLANIMLCRREDYGNYVKILDFGLAKAILDDTSITGSAVLGTAGYLAPEVLQGRTPDLRADVYALGVLFYTMLAGRMPFEGPAPGVVLKRTLHDPPPPLAARVTDLAIPPGLIELIHRCLDKDPDRRPRDADALGEALCDIVPLVDFKLPRIPRSPTSTGFRSTVHASSTPPSGASLPTRKVTAASFTRWNGMQLGAVLGLVVLVLAVLGSSAFLSSDRADRVARELVHRPALESVMLTDFTERVRGAAVRDRSIVPVVLTAPAKSSLRKTKHQSRHRARARAASRARSRHTLGKPRGLKATTKRRARSQSVFLGQARPGRNKPARPLGLLPM